MPGAPARSTLHFVRPAQIAIVILLAAILFAASPARAQEPAAFLPIVSVEPGDGAVPGIWCWFGNPRALHYVGLHDRTYWGAVDHLGNILIYAYDHDDGRLTNAILHERLNVNDHANPALLMRADGRFVVFYSAHNGPAVYERISVNTEDISAWGAEVDLDPVLGVDRYTYPSPVQLTGEPGSPIYLFVRAFHPNTPIASWRDTHFIKSLDGGLTWSPKQTLFVNQGQRPFRQFARNGTDRIDFAITDGAPDQVEANSLYHMYYQGGRFHRNDGTVIEGGPPFEPHDGSLIWDGAEVEAWLWDIAIDEAGRPLVAYDVFPSETDHRYRVARWTGTAWLDAEVVAAGTYLYRAAPMFSGGIALDRTDTDTVYLSKESGGQWQMWEYATDDGGLSWRPVRALTDASPWVKARPVSPLNAHLDLRVLWWEGVYDSFTRYKTNLHAYPVALPGVNTEAVRGASTWP